MSKYLGIHDLPTDDKKELKYLVSKKTMELLSSKDIHNLDDFYKKYEIRLFWGNLSKKIAEKDRIRLEKMLLENSIVDGFAYYRMREYAKEDYIIKYESVLSDDGNLRIVSNEPHTIEERIVIDRLRRIVEIETTTSDYYTKTIKEKVSYFVIEDLFEQLRADDFSTLYVLGEFACSENLTLTHLSGNKDEYGVQVTGIGMEKVNRFLASLGVGV